MSLIKVNTIQNANGTTALTIAANGQLSSVNTAVANVTTLNATSGVLATQNGMTGVPKAWARFNGTTSPATIASSFNVSSVTKITTGQFSVNFTTAMPNTNYCAVGSNNSGQTLTNYAFVPTTTAVNVTTGDVSFNNFADFVYTSVILS